MPTMETDARNQSQTATNLILYGPPGTGKTYATAWEAVRLCIGDEAAGSLKNNRAALMGEYRRLVDEGRIEFSTFHQSMTYEEFVEGLRPSTGEDDLEARPEAETNAGFSLKCHEGIFKRISERARLDQGDCGGAQHLDRSQGLFKISLIGLDWRNQLAKAVQDNGIAWGFGAGNDWSAPEFEDFDAIKQKWQQSHPDISSGPADISGTWYFRGAIEQLQSKGVDLKATEQPVDTSTPAGKAFLQMLGVFSEFETSLRKERQMEGIAKAKERGEYKGRKPSIDPSQVKQMHSEGMSPTAIAKELGIARSSVYRLCS